MRVRPNGSPPRSTPRIRTGTTGADLASIELDVGRPRCPTPRPLRGRPRPDPDPRPAPPRPGPCRDGPTVTRWPRAGPEPAAGDHRPCRPRPRDDHEGATARPCVPGSARTPSTPRPPGASTASTTPPADGRARRAATPRPVGRPPPTRSGRRAIRRSDLSAPAGRTGSAPARAAMALRRHGRHRHHRVPALGGWRRTVRRGRSGARRACPDRESRPAACLSGRRAVAWRPRRRPRRPPGPHSPGRAPAQAAGPPPGAAGPLVAAAPPHPVPTADARAPTEAGARLGHPQPARRTNRERWRWPQDGRPTQDAMTRRLRGPDPGRLGRGWPRSGGFPEVRLRLDPAPHPRRPADCSGARIATGRSGRPARPTRPGRPEKAQKHGPIEPAVARIATWASPFTGAVTLCLAR